MLVSKIGTLTLLSFLVAIANAGENCRTLYNFNLSNEELLAKEQNLINSRLQKSGGIVFKNCVEKVKNAIDANAVRVRADQYRITNTVSGIESVFIYACDGKTSDGVLKMFFKIKRFEPISSAKSDGFSTFEGCPEFDENNSPNATIENSFTRLEK